ncbi:DUF402 domain-containing protein [Calidifontibacter sp. DB0510]|uniref:DUF402 domain-containing protein n=1 Tax=Metallococcus carri TaxID=1656884 RepID=A0A967ED24_9MICO|nr:DUF402 domain-containing protein [Metallococcus carri]NHN54301.1 DUF402 domain-containing protein [Metallococcus carri]NOP36859.1 YgaC family protein [Calidifontibacter sp. DB2511S]
MRPTSETPAGTPVHCDFRKFDGTEHWQEDYQLLGVDADGVWLGMPAGTPFARPDFATTAKTDTVRLITDAGYAACFNGPGNGQRTHVYVDITDQPVWRRDGDRFVVTLVDLDLDVIERFDGTTFVDDEDEFAEHQASFGYPAQVVTHAQRTCDAVFAAVRAKDAPFDGRGDARLGQISRR